MPPSSVNSGSGGRMSLNALPEQPSIERQRLQRTSGQCSAVEFRAIVRMPRIGPQLDLGIDVEHFDRFGPSLQKARAQQGVGAVADDLPQVSLDVLDTVGGCGRVTRVRDPDRAGRKRRRAADKAGLLHQQRSGAANGGEQRRRHARGTGADHDDIIVWREVGQSGTEQGRLRKRWKTFSPGMPRPSSVHQPTQQPLPEARKPQNQ